MTESKNIALVTGASSGLGLSISQLLISDGWVVFGVSRSEQSTGLKKLTESENFTHVVGDVSDSKLVARAVGNIESTGHLKMVVNCAGQGVFGPAGGYDAEKLNTVLAGNLIGTVLISEATLPLLIRHGGTLINVMSTAATMGRAGEAIYCAAKWGARGYTESLRIELKGQNIRIMSVFPGGMNTPFWENSVNSKTDPLKFMDPEVVAKLIYSNTQSPDGVFVSDLIINRG